MFQPSLTILAEVSERLSDYANIFWVIGGAASGKSTICANIGSRLDLAIYDMDAHFFGSYAAEYRWDRHPAVKTWFSAQDPLSWVLSLESEAFDALNQACQVECLDLFAADVSRNDNRSTLIVDGGITHPSLLASVTPVEHIICLYVDPDASAEAWNKAPERLEMKEMVMQLPDGEEAWRAFLAADRQITLTLLAECQKLGVSVLARKPKESVRETADTVIRHFSLLSDQRHG